MFWFYGKRGKDVRSEATTERWPFLVPSGNIFELVLVGGPTGTRAAKKAKTPYGTGNLAEQPGRFRQRDLKLYKHILWTQVY